MLRASRVQGRSGAITKLALAATAVSLVVGCSSAIGGSGGATGSDASGGGAQAAGPGSFGLASSATPSPDGRMTVGLALPSDNPERWERDAELLATELEARGYAPEIGFAGPGSGEQAQIIDGFIDDNVDLILITEAGDDQLATALEAAREAEIPVLAYDRMLNNTEAVTGFVGYDSFALGVSQARSVLQGASVLGADGRPRTGALIARIEIFAGDIDDPSARRQFDGTMSVLRPLIDGGTVTIPSGLTAFEQVATADGSATLASERASSIRAQQVAGGDSAIDRLDGVIAADDEIAGAVVAAFSDLETRAPSVSGMDATPMAALRVIDEQQYSTELKDSRELAVAAADAAQRILSGGELDSDRPGGLFNGARWVPSRVLDFTTITEHNAQLELFDSGYYDLEELLQLRTPAAPTTAGMPGTAAATPATPGADEAPREE